MSTTQKPKIESTLAGYGSKVAPEIMQRIDMLGDMNDRHKIALGNRDKQTLEEIATEYIAINCPSLARSIRAEAKAIRAAVPA